MNAQQANHVCMLRTTWTEDDNRSTSANVADVDRGIGSYSSKRAQPGIEPGTSRKHANEGRVHHPKRESYY